MLLEVTPPNPPRGDFLLLSLKGKLSPTGAKICISIPWPLFSYKAPKDLYNSSGFAFSFQSFITYLFLI
jgi:hypothetical protein